MAVGIKGEGPCCFHRLRKLLHRVRMPGPMKLYTFETRGQPRLGAEWAGRLIDLNTVHAARLGAKNAVLAATMIDLIRGGETALKQTRQALAFAQKNAGSARARTWSHHLTRARLLAPIARPGKILCSGLNYKSHVQE